MCGHALFVTSNTGFAFLCPAPAPWQGTCKRSTVLTTGCVAWVRFQNYCDLLGAITADKPQAVPCWVRVHQESHCVPCAVYCLLQADVLGGVGAATGMSLGASTTSGTGGSGSTMQTRLTQLPPGTYSGPEYQADGSIVEARPMLPGDKTCRECEKACRALKVDVDCQAEMDAFSRPACVGDDMDAKSPCMCIVTCKPAPPPVPRESKQSGAIGRWRGHSVLVFPAVVLSLWLFVWG